METRFFHKLYLYNESGFFHMTQLRQRRYNNYYGHNSNFEVHLNARKCLQLPPMTLSLFKAGTVGWNFSYQIANLKQNSNNC